MLISNQSSVTIFVEITTETKEESGILFLPILPNRIGTFEVQSVYHIHSETKGSAVFVSCTETAIICGNLKLEGDKEHLIIT